MTAEEIQNVIKIGLDVVNIAIDAGGNAVEIYALIKKISAWYNGTATPTTADFAMLKAMAKAHLDRINDTSRDDPTVSL